LNIYKNKLAFLGKMSYEACILYSMHIQEAIKKKVPEEEMDKMYLTYGYLAAHYEISQNYSYEAKDALLKVYKIAKRRLKEKKNSL
jgi:hypothetical protein